MEIIPAILTADPLEMDVWLRQIRDRGKFSRVQVDFDDGAYLGNVTIKPGDCDLVSYSPLKYDAHLMVVGDNVLFWGQAAEQMGFDRVFYQIEGGNNVKSKPFLAVDLETRVEQVLPYLKHLKVLLLMSVPAGRGHQRFDGRVIEKIRWAKNRGLRVAVDGGIERQHLAQLEELGVDEVVVGVKRVLEW